MTPSDTFSHRLVRVLCAGLFAAVACVARAQETGAVAGRVSEQATGRALQGASISVLGSPATAVADAEGRFMIAGLPAGTVELEVEYVGFATVRRRVSIEGGRVVTANVSLGDAVVELAELAIHAQASGAAAAINQQRTAAGILNIVSEENFGQMINGNIGYALQRLPGLTVNEDEDGTPTGVNIRGLESKYNSFQIDGNRVPTSGNTRAFSTNQLGGDGISSIEVIKAATPDRDGDAIGGIINVNTRSAFQRDGRTIEVTAGGLYYDKNSDWGYNAGLNYLDIFSVGGGERNLGVALNLSAYETSRDYDNLDKDYALLRPENEPSLGLTGPVYFHTNGTPQTNFRTTTSRGLNLSFDYRLSDRAAFYLRPFYSRNTVEAEKPRNRFYINSNHNFNGPTGTKTIAEATYNTGRSLATVTNDIRYQNEVNQTDNDAYGLSLGGRHELDTILFNYDAFWSENVSNRDFSWSYVIRNPGYNIGYDQTRRARPVYTILNGKDPYNITAISRGDLTNNPRDGAERARSLKADWEKSFVGTGLSGSLKLGAKYRINEKSQDQSSRVWRTGTAASGFPYGDILRRSDRSVFGIPMYLEPDMSRVLALMQSQPGRFVLQTNDALLNDVINDYEAEEDILAGYIMGTVRRGDTSVIAGLRAERNQFESHTWRYNSSTPASPTPVRADRDYTVWLPGIHLRHELRNNVILRASYNRSYSRPDINAMVAGLQLDQNTGNMSGGNPNLKETTSDNYDVQVEYYTANRGLYSAGFFYKDMKGFYYESSYRFSTTDANGYPIEDPAGPYTFTTTRNARGAVNHGIELIARQKLVFLPRPFDGLGVSLSATFTESDGKYPGREDEKLPTYGFSDRIYNAGLEYTFGRFHAQLTYTYRSDYLEGLDVDNTFDDYFGAYESLNWESTFQLTDSVRLFFNVNNLTNEPQISYQGYKRTDNPEDYTTYGWRATMGATVKF